MNRREWLQSLRHGDVVYLPLHHPARIDKRTVTATGTKYITLNGGARVFLKDGQLENAPYTPIYPSIEEYRHDMRLWARLHDIVEGLHVLSRMRKPQSITTEEIERLHAAFVGLGAESTAKSPGKPGGV